MSFCCCWLIYWSEIRHWTTFRLDQIRHSDYVKFIEIEGERTQEETKTLNELTKYIAKMNLVVSLMYSRY